MANLVGKRSILWKYILALCSIVILSTSFKQSDDQKIWDTNSPLTWDDFKGMEKDKKFDSETKSNTFIGEPYKYKRLGSDSNSYVFEFQVRSVMVRSKSWVDPASKTPSLLAHEQLHFDISEYFARQLLLAFRNATYSHNFINEIKDIRHKLSVQRTTMENLYDEQTVHSQNAHMQSKWNVYVQSLLQTNESLENALKKLP
ncbi:hypothetical protein [Pedobacter sp. L105]|uniref:hypothetical protein n=1 Tax=Pedobacter sp. L105 TaxID=1641871 RepID=UPI00131D8FBF|nr:hypothetical protein [Pedobacter sp. L105]